MYTYIHRHVLACERGYVYYAYERDSVRECGREKVRVRERKGTRFSTHVHVCVCPRVCVLMSGVRDGSVVLFKDVRCACVYGCVEACVVS